MNSRPAVQLRGRGAGYQLVSVTPLVAVALTDLSMAGNPFEANYVDGQGFGGGLVAAPFGITPGTTGSIGTTTATDVRVFDNQWSGVNPQGSRIPAVLTLTSGTLSYAYNLDTQNPGATNTPASLSVVAFGLTRGSVKKAGILSTSVAASAPRYQVEPSSGNAGSVVFDATFGPPTGSMVLEFDPDAAANITAAF